jgi:hypothetical protein
MGSRLSAAMRLSSPAEKEREVPILCSGSTIDFCEFDRAAISVFATPAGGAGEM